MKRVLCTTALVLIAAAAAFGDIARPDSTPKRTPKPKQVDASHDYGEQVTATLRIPRSQVNQLRAELERLTKTMPRPQLRAAYRGRRRSLAGCY